MNLKNVVLLTSICFSVSSVGFAQSAKILSERTVAAIGTGEISVAPDIANITLSVTTKAKTLKAAGDENAQKSKDVLDSLIAMFNLKKNDYRNSISQSDDISYDNGKSTLVGQIVQNRMTIKVRQLDQIGAAIDLIVSKGAKSDYITYGLENPQPVKELALRQASLNAKANAQALLKPFSKSVGDIVAVVESGAQAPVYRSAGESARAMPAAAPGGSFPTQVDSGPVTVSASATLVFLIQ